MANEQRVNRLGLWLIVTGPSVWALHFAACYGAAAIFCEKAGGDGATGLRVLIGVLTLGALAVLAGILIRTLRQWGFLHDFVHQHDEDSSTARHRFIGHAAFLLSALSAIGVVYTALPAIFVPGVCQ